mmetsp:Transcript_60085/g.178906  ORF Transcript_60085/g.178906 Transcript_60085/m.178906 type:complete len:238 (-) Transcript_60085:541-1254(-)
MPDDAGVLAGDLAVIHLVEHAVPDLAVKQVFVLVGLLPRNRQVAGVEHDGAAVKPRLVHSVGSRDELPMRELRHVNPLGGELVLLDHVPLLGGEHLRGGAADVVDVHLLDVRAELAVGQDAVLLAHLVEVLQEPVPRRPGRVEHGWDGVVLVKLKVVSTILGLQLGRGVRLVHPRGATNPVHPVEDDEVCVLLLQEDHRGLEANVPSPDDGLRVPVLHPGLLEALDPADGHLRPDLV